VDVLYADLLRAGERPGPLRDVLQQFRPDQSQLVAVLRRAVPRRLLELVGTTPPWSEDPRVLGGVVLNPASSRALALRLVPELYWRDLAEAAASMRLSAALRLRAESLLSERLTDLRLGERITLSRLATPAVLRPLLLDPEPKVSQASLLNPRLRESDLVQAIQKDTAPAGLLRQVAASTRWRQSYAVRLALVLQPRTPLGVALAQLSSLLNKDLIRISETAGLLPLVQMSALRVARSVRTLDS
jgi:hypothetical protein